MKTFQEFYEDEVASSDTPYTTEREVVLFGIDRLSDRIAKALIDDEAEEHAADVDLAHARMYVKYDAYLAAAQAIDAGFDKFL